MGDDNETMRPRSPFPENEVVQKVHDDFSSTTFGTKASENEYEIDLDKLKPYDDSPENKELYKRLQMLGPDVMQRPQMAAKLNPFKLEWAFGFDKDAVIINLCQSIYRNLVLFNVAQFGVLYDFKSSTMNFLEGHPNNVVSLSSMNNGKVIASADSGPDNVIIVWKREDCSPLAIFFSPPGDTSIVLQVALSRRGRYLVSVLKVDQQHIRIDLRLWIKGEQTPDGSRTMENHYGKLLTVQFSIDCEQYFALLFEKGVAFFTWDEETSSLKEPVLSVTKMRPKIGHFTDITYIEQCHEVFASTSEGCIVFFGATLYYQHFDEKNLNNNLKLLKICKTSKVSINSIDSADRVLITGDEQGAINIFDNRLRLLFWYKKYMDKPINSIKFELVPRSFRRVPFRYAEVIGAPEGTPETFEDYSDKIDLLYRDQVLKDASIWNAEWIIRNFIIVQDGKVSHVDCIKKIHTVFYDRGHGEIGGISIHDSSPHLAIGYKNGILCLVDYRNNFVHVTQKLPTVAGNPKKPVVITCLQYSYKSLHLACGRSNGEIWLLDPILLIPRQKVDVCNMKIQKIVFSKDNKQLAFCSTSSTVFLMVFRETDVTWVFRGKMRRHYKRINEMLFLDDDPKLLITIATGRRMNIYNNVDLIDEKEELEVCLDIRLDQSAIPLTLIQYPPKHSKSEFRYWIVADNQHKYKLINERTLMCRKVALGPAYNCYYNDPVRKIRVLPGHNDDYLVYMTRKYFGLQKLPITGNPYSFVGRLGSPDGLLDFQIGGNGDYVFTLSNNGTSVLRWKTHTEGVDLMEKLGGRHLEPFYCVIEGGKSGFLFQEMQDLFFYMQILHEGEHSTLPRKVSDKLAIIELPDLMRACGYYPTDYEVENFMVDIKYRNYDKDGSVADYISFVDFVQLYVNYKPVYGYSLSALEKTFDVFASFPEDAIHEAIHRTDFINLLTNEGEAFTTQDMIKCMETLLGAKATKSDEENHDILDFIPETITQDTFVNNILGIDMDRETIEAKKSGSTSQNN